MFSASLWISKMEPMERQNSRAWQLFFLFLRHGAYNTHFFLVDHKMLRQLQVQGI